MQTKKRMSAGLGSLALFAQAALCAEPASLKQGLEEGAARAQEEARSSSKHSPEAGREMEAEVFELLQKPQKYEAAVQSVAVAEVIKENHLEKLALEKRSLRKAIAVKRLELLAERRELEKRGPAERREMRGAALMGLGFAAITGSMVGLILFHSMAAFATGAVGGFAMIGGGTVITAKSGAGQRTYRLYEVKAQEQSLEGLQNRLDAAKK